MQYLSAALIVMTRITSWKPVAGRLGRAGSDGWPGVEQGLPPRQGQAGSPRGTLLSTGLRNGSLP